MPGRDVGRWRDRVRRWFGKDARRGERTAAFRLQYERFREILALNDRALELLADLEERAGGDRPFALEPLVGRVRQAAMDVFVMIKDLNLISGGRYADLYAALARVNAEVEAEAGPSRRTGRLVVPMSEARAGDAGLIGAKMARLGEVRAVLGMRVPEGFVVTTAAFDRFMEGAGLWERASRLEGVLEMHGPRALAEACREVGEAIRGAAVPEEVSGAIRAALGAADGPRVWAVRSSATGEDSGRWSHAGVYRTVLDVADDGVIGAYREVVAAGFSAQAVTYRYERGIPSRETAMAVGILRMVHPRCAGTLFTRRPEAPGEDAVVLSATPGLGDRVAAGTAPQAWHGVVRPGADVPGGGLRVGEATRLIEAGRRIETLFGGPQDIEWAVAPDGVVVILQARPLRVEGVGDGRGEGDTSGTQAPLADGSASARPRDAVLLCGGLCANPGVAVGPVVLMSGEADLDAFPEGGVLVAKNAAPVLSRAMGRAAAVVTEVGSPTGHTAILAREAGIPMIVGMANACARLRPRQMVRVDTVAREVADATGAAPTGRPRRPLGSDSPAHKALRRLARHLVPLHLTDPASPDFVPDNARSLHDLTRYVHEKAFEVMFLFGDRAASGDREHSFRLSAALPLEVRVFDVGGGVVVDREPGGSVGVEDILSRPMRAFLDGMLRVRWDRPRAVSARGFLSVLGEGLAAPPAESLVGRLSYAIVSDRYMNFSTRAGYHFSTVDAWCGASRNKNYVHFRFNGGAADPERRARRVRFLDEVMRALDFRTWTRGDILAARLDKVEEEVIADRLLHLGRLTLAARQMDMLMDSDASPARFAEAFLRGDLDGG